MPLYRVVVFVFSQLKGCTLKMHYFLNSAPNAVPTQDRIYPVQVNIYKRLKIPLPLKSKEHVFLLIFFFLVNSDSSNGPALLFLSDFQFWCSLGGWVFLTHLQDAFGRLAGIRRHD